MTPTFIPPPQCPHAAAVRTLAAASLLLSLFVLSGCASAPKSAAESASTPAAASQNQPAPASKGGYYLDDGPEQSPPPNLEATPDAQVKDEPLHKFANRPYDALGQSFLPDTASKPFKQRGMASWYGKKFHGKKTASGEPYDMYAMTAAHPTLPIPSYARITNPKNRKSVVVRINDRGPFRSSRIIDLSYTAALKLGYLQQGSSMVELERIFPGDSTLGAITQAATPDNATAPPPVSTTALTATPTTVDPIAALAQPEEGLPDSKAVYLQLGAFKGEASANNFRDRIQRQLDWLSDAVHVSAQGNLFRVRLGPYRSLLEARTISDRIRQTLAINPHISAQ